MIESLLILVVVVVFALWLIRQIPADFHPIPVVLQLVTIVLALIYLVRLFS